ncbi:ABC transporter substrate-binding protein [Phreatobacter stygius]|uniref:ABC transporter substrate-binding protein n=1 Tax=Phreatobacter stygius TaxID=1940610 RepID=A0A4D7BC44_9HYPH|nr:ABC transporter substrate-binding protein [Phreatobacter stygius]QCI68350.1 ABC transporter substrate-binding protein [Phreatobacter stygius]
MTISLTRRAALGAAAALASPRLVRAAAVEIVVHYSQPVIFKDSKEQLAAAFASRHPDIKVSFISNTPNYEEGVQYVLRQAITGTLPDLSYQGLNRVRAVAERGLATDLAPLIARDGGAAKLGYSPAILGQGRVGEAQVGLPYAMSNTILYINADLVRRAGADPLALGASWDAILPLARAIKDVGSGVDGFYIDWMPGQEWMWSSLLYSHGGRMMSVDEREIAFDGPEGLSATRLIDRMVKQGGMSGFTSGAAQQAFFAGKLGIMMRSTAALRGMISGVAGNFELLTATVPIPGAAQGRLATGGSCGMILARDPARREAAWTFLKFSTSAEGTAIMAKATGYVPCNQIAVDDPAYLADFYRTNPLFLPATRQLPLSLPWYAFPGANGVRIGQAFVDNLARVVEQKAAPEQVLTDIARETRRLLARA